MKQRTEHQRAVGLLVITAVLWSMGGLLIKSIHWHPVAIAATRSAFASVLLLLFLRKPKFIWSVAQWGSAIGYAGTVILFVSATKLTTAANAILLQYTAPIYVALLSSWFLDEPITKMDWFAILAVLAGMVLFFMDPSSNLVAGAHFLGNILAVASGVAFAMMVLCMRKQKGESTQESVLLGNLITVVIGLPFIIDHLPASTEWLPLATLGFVQLGLPYILYAIAIKHVTAMEGILIPMIEPILNPIWVLLFFGEKPSLMAMTGGVVVISAITLRGVALSQRQIKD